MNTFHGKSVYKGIAIGKLKFWKKGKNEIPKYHVFDPQSEYSRFKLALKNTINQIDEIKHKAYFEIGEENADIFEIHKLMLYDQDYLEFIENLILNDALNAEYAVYSACNYFADKFSKLSDKYMQARAIDIKDISSRLICMLRGKDNKVVLGDEPVILVAEEFTPSETLQLDKSKILAFITSKGSLNSHTAILARAMNIPAIIGVDIITNDNFNGKYAIVDGFSGKVYINPDKEILELSHNRFLEEKNKKESLQSLIGKESKTADGKKIHLYANIGNIKDISSVLENDAEGIGLFRSEFIYMENNTFPSEEDQYSIYKKALEMMHGKKIIIRTLDIGSDKKADYFRLESEENPALGLRGIRLCIRNPDILKVQLRALLRASVHGNLAIMYPMITSVKEVTIAKNILLQAADDLNARGVPYKIPEQGIMIETPAAVMISDDLAKEVSFFSIGTNDLSQYTLAIDRQNQNLDEFFDPYHPSILKMIEITVKNAHKNNIWVGICGELAVDFNIIETLLKLGVDELSVSPGNILDTRKKITEINVCNKNER